jgi:hypothetical protein
LEFVLMSRSSTNTSAKLTSRQRLLVSLAEALGGKASPIDFQKLLFLYVHEVEAEPSFEFVPYLFGCFSFGSYAERRRLIAARLLEEDDRTWRLTEAGQILAREPDLNALKIYEFVRKHERLRGTPLAAEVYRRYPYYAIRSQIINQVLLSPKDREKVDAARPPKRKPGLLTIGYEGKSLETYLNQLIKAGVTLLCDVRRNAISRKYGFSGSTLSEACKKVGIFYTHLPGLGIASSERRNLSKNEDYAALFSAYRKKSLPKHKAELDQIQNWIVNENHRVALTCFERDPNNCHRHCVAEAIAKRAGMGVAALHLR